MKCSIGGERAHFNLGLRVKTMLAFNVSDEPEAECSVRTSTGGLVCAIKVHPGILTQAKRDGLRVQFNMKGLYFMCVFKESVFCVCPFVYIPVTSFLPFAALF